MNINLYVLYGGKSVEHEVSLKTAHTVMRALDRSTYNVYPVYITREGLWCCAGAMDEPFASPEEWVQEPACGSAAESLSEVLAKYFALPGKRAALPLLHGSYGEDGTVQGLLELLDVPYVGNGVMAAAVTLDKAMCKKVIAQAGIAQTKHVEIRAESWGEDRARLLEAVERELGYPCYVKPASLGSSIGISRCEDRERLLGGIGAALRYDGKLVVEREVAGREIQVAVMGNENPIASLPGEFIHRHAFFDFESKYMDKELVMQVPADVTEETAEKVRDLALRAYRAVECAGLARVDFFLNEKGELYLNEINAFPGFTGTSMYPVMWERTAGITYAALIERLIHYALIRYEDKRQLQYAR